jgi:hypothetical protein
VPADNTIVPMEPQTKLGGDGLDDIGPVDGYPDGSQYADTDGIFQSVPAGFA